MVDALRVVFGSAGLLVGFVRVLRGVFRVARFMAVMALYSVFALLAIVHVVAWFVAALLAQVTMLVVPLSVILGVVGVGPLAGSGVDAFVVSAVVIAAAYAMFVFAVNHVLASDVAGAVGAARGGKRF